MATAIYDTLIIGGGPGGSTAASYLARAGKRVLLLEKEVFPRFHIGESLLPYNRRIFDEIGVLPKLRQAGLIKKYGAQFHLGNGSKSIKFVFREGRFTEETEAFQVERAQFDHLLLNHAKECGAEVREGWTVSRFSSNSSEVCLEARHPESGTESFKASFLIDASGRGNLTGNQEGLRQFHPKLKKIAIFGHFTGVATDRGEKSGDTVIVRLQDKWFWLIPLSPEKTSVGCVLDQTEFAQSGASSMELFNQTWRSSAALRERLAEARLLGKIQTTSDFSYCNRRFFGQRLLRVGDAAGFMDPIFSAGVYLAMYTAKLATQAILQSLEAGDDGSIPFHRYHDRVNRTLKSYWRMAQSFYSTPFMEVFLAPRERFYLLSTVNALLAGSLEGGLAMRWRLGLFFWLIRLQHRWTLVPRISFD